MICYTQAASEMSNTGIQQHSVITLSMYALYAIYDYVTGTLRLRPSFQKPIHEEDLTYRESRC